MPKLTLTQDIEIKPERFLNQCSPAELFETWRLIQQKDYQDKIDLLLTGSIAATSEVIKDQRPAFHGKTIKYRKYCDGCGKPKHCQMYGIKYLCDQCANAPAPDKQLEGPAAAPEEVKGQLPDRGAHFDFCTICKTTVTDFVYQGHPTCVACALHLMNNI